MELVLLFLYGVIAITCAGLCLYFLQKVLRTEKKEKVEKKKGIKETVKQIGKSFWRKYMHEIVFSLIVTVFWSILSYLLLATGKGTQQFVFEGSMVVFAIVVITFFLGLICTSEEETKPKAKAKQSF